MIGKVVGNHKIVRKLGEGGMGAVYSAVHFTGSREVAIKVLRPELASQPEIVERFLTEAMALAKLSHPNIEFLYDFFRQGDDFFMVMEYVRGETLDSFIRRSGAMPYQEAIPLFCQAVDGIYYARKMGVIHRDIKPGNMMVTDNRTLKVMDFVIARVLSAAHATRPGHGIGAIEYMSPEQVRGLETDARSDIYSLGVLFYEMLTGVVPFSASSDYELVKMQIEDAPRPPRSFSPDIPKAVEQAIMRSLAKTPGERFQNALDFRRVVDSALPKPPLQF